MNEQKKCLLQSNKGNDVVGRRKVRPDYRPEPTLYSSVIQTESKLKRISIVDDDDDEVDTKLKSTASKAGLKKVNFPLTEQIYNYSNMVDVGLHSNVKPVAKRKPREMRTSPLIPVPKLEDYYRPCYDNIQQIEINTVRPSRELTVQYDGLALTRLINEIDKVVFE